MSWPMSAAEAIRRGDQARDVSDWPLAVNEYRRALDVASDLAPIWVQLGHALKETGRHAEAESAYRQALTLEPDNPDTYIQLGHILKIRIRWVEAAECYAYARTLDPNLDLVAIEMANVAHFMAREGRLEASFGRFDNAVAWFRRALALRPDFPSVWLELGEQLETDGDVDGAEEAARRALALYPNRSKPRLLLARLLRRQGDRSAALAEVARAVLALRAERAPRERVRDLESVLPDAAFYDQVPAHVAAVRLGTVGAAGPASATMPLDLFTRIIDELAALGLVVTGWLEFGLFGDPLLDPLLMARAEIVRHRLPDVSLQLGTDGAGFDPARHAGLGDWIAGLRLRIADDDENGQARTDAMLAAFPGLVTIVVTVTRANFDARAAIRQSFLDRGAAAVVFQPLRNRCGGFGPRFQDLAIDPRPLDCTSEILEDLNIDHDGTLVICTQDEARREPIGNIAGEALGRLLRRERRARLWDVMDRGGHAALATCRVCRADRATTVALNEAPAVNARGFETGPAGAR